MMPPTCAKFDRLRETERKDFYASLKGPKWWTKGGKKDSARGWAEVFKKTDWKCIYCGRDLATSTDVLAESTEEHLVPRSLLETNGAEPNVMENMAACCAGCNTLKGEYVPPKDHRCWESREEFVEECKRFISKQRLNNYRKYQEHVEKVLRKRAGE